MPRRRDHDVWSQQRGESGRAFHAFGRYRDAGSSRSLRAAASDLGKSVQLLERWSARWQWTRRVEAYDQYLDALQRAENEKGIKDFRQRSAQQARAASQTLMLPSMAISARIERARAAGQTIEQLFDGLTMPELVRLAIDGGRTLPALLAAEAQAIGDGRDRIQDAVVAHQVDVLQARVDASPELRSLAAVFIEKATTTPGLTGGGTYDPKP